MKMQYHRSFYLMTYLAILIVFSLIGCALGINIVEFSANPNVINEGESCTLQWDVVGAERIEIDNGA